MSTLQRRYKLAVLSVAAYDRPPLSSRWLIESCRGHGIDLTLIGQGRPFTHSYCKIRIIAEYLTANPAIELALVVDFRDVIFCAGLRELVSKYLAYDLAIVTAAERISWPISSHGALVPPLGTTYRHLNSGTIFSTASAWQDAWRWMQNRKHDLAGSELESGEQGHTIFTSDQAAWSDYYIHAGASIGLDHRCEMFQALATIDNDLGAANRDLLFEGRRVVNRETGGRPCLLHPNGSIPVDRWGKYVFEPSPAWNGPLIQRIRLAPRAALQDVDCLTRLLLDLGLQEKHDELIDEALLPYCGKGLGISYQPYEFAKYLIWLSERPPIDSFLQIGVGSGGSFITTIEYLRRFHPLRLACGTGRRFTPAVQDYCSRTTGTRLIAGPRSSATAQFGTLLGQFHLAAIEAEEDKTDIYADWSTARQHSRMVSLHPIVSSPCPAASSLWSDIKSTGMQTYDFIDHEHFKPCGIGVVDFGLGY